MWERGSKGVWAILEGAKVYELVWVGWAMNHTHTDSYCNITWNQDKLNFVVRSAGLLFASKVSHCQILVVIANLIPCSTFQTTPNPAFQHWIRSEGNRWYHIVFTGDLWRRSRVTQFRGNFSSAEVKQQENLVMLGGGSVDLKCLRGPSLDIRLFNTTVLLDTIWYYLYITFRCI